MRVPTPNVSVVDFVAQVEKKTFTEQVNQVFKEAAEGPLKGFWSTTICLLFLAIIAETMLLRSWIPA
jgi:glyceraldehyde-3-phosphate dehydrogenase/erythrose-4-phosphate dehydrogenase